MRRFFVSSLLLAGLFAAPALAASPEQGHVPTVFVTRSGRSYHLPSCRFLSMSRKAIPLSRVTGRYKPCTFCQPPHPDAGAEPQVRAASVETDALASALER